jgi:hypothetical protein
MREVKGVVAVFTALDDLVEALTGITLGSIEAVVIDAAGYELIQNWNDHNEDAQIDPEDEMVRWQARMSGPPFFIEPGTSKWLFRIPQVATVAVSIPNGDHKVIGFAAETRQHLLEQVKHWVEEHGQNRLEAPPVPGDVEDWLEEYFGQSEYETLLFAAVNTEHFES